MWGQPPSAVHGRSPACFRTAQLMRKKSILSLIGLLLLASCSPRDFLSRRLAADLIAASDPFKTPQQFILQTGVVSNTDYVSPESLVLQHHGWISASGVPCKPGIAPPPCWDVLLTPSGADTVVGGRQALQQAAYFGKPFSASHHVVCLRKRIASRKR